MDYISAEKELEDDGHKQGRKISKTGFLEAVALGAFAAGVGAHFVGDLAADAVKKTGATDHVGKKLVELHNDWKTKWEEHVQGWREGHDHYMRLWNSNFNSDHHSHNEVDHRSLKHKPGEHSLDSHISPRNIKRHKSDPVSSRSHSRKRDTLLV